MAKHRNPLPTAEEKAKRKSDERAERIKKVAIAVGIVAAVLVAFFVYSHFFGNPISKMSASQNIKKYVAETFVGVDLDISSVGYDRESASFYALASSPTSQDTRFYVYCKNGMVYDYYEDSVKNLYNTLERLEEAFSETAKQALAGESLVDVSLSATDFINALASGEFSLDMKVTTELKTEFAVYITLKGEPTVEGLAAALKSAKETLEKEDLPKMAFYNLTLEGDEKTAKAYNVSGEEIDGDLEATLQHAYENPFEELSDVENTNPLTVSIR